MVGALLVLGILALAGLLLRMPLNDFRYVAGMSGMSGTFSATQCHTVPWGRGTSHACTGTFVASGGGFTDRAAHLTDARIEPGRPVTLQREPDGSCVRPLASDAAMDLAAAFGIVWVAAFLSLLVCVAPCEVTVGSDVPLRSNPPPWGTALPLFGWLFVGSGTATVLSFLASFTLRLSGR